MNETEFEIPKILEKEQNTEIKKVAGDTDEDSFYVLKNRNFNKYLSLNDKEFFIWKAIDHEPDFAKVNLLFLKQYGFLPLGFIERFLLKLCKNGFISNYPFNIKDLKYKQVPWAIKIKIPFFEQVFRHIYTLSKGFLFSKLTFCFYALISIVGLYLFLKSPSITYSLENTIESYMYVFLAIAIPITIHEFSHAMVCYHYEREVKEVGFMLYMFMPVFYVDISDMWMVERKGRMVSSLVGPLSDFIVGCLGIILYHLFQTHSFAVFFYIGASLSFVRILFNLNPLLKWDGYYFLMDLLNINNLKRESSRFLFNKLPRKMYHFERINAKEFKLMLFGFLSTTYVIFIVYKVLSTITQESMQILISGDFGNLTMNVLVGYAVLLMIIVSVLLKVKTVATTIIKKLR